MTSVITLDSTSVKTLAQATERNPPPLILPVKPPMHSDGVLCNNFRDEEKGQVLT